MHMVYYSIENENMAISPGQIKKAVIAAVESAATGQSMLIIPPDITRLHSGAGIITEMLWEEYKDKIKDIMPALGTHRGMSANETENMFGQVPQKLFRKHDCRNDIITLGKVPGSFLYGLSEKKVNYDWPVQINKLINESTNSLIVSIGQVVPHEVTGMANHNKNIFIGCGGYESINKSHFLGAACGMEKLMGKAMNPVREVINRGDNLFANHLNILYILTVIGTGKDGLPAIKGLFTGTDTECFNKAASLSSKLNIKMMDRPPGKILVYLNPFEYRSTWLGNKAIYRTRMAIADGGELVIIAPGLKMFGEDRLMDRLIRKYGYRPSHEIISLAEKNDDLRHNLGVAAHLIHGSPEGRFSVTYCTDLIIKKEIQDAGFGHADIEDIKAKYNFEKLREGYNISGEGEEFYYIPNPALGLWAARDKFTA